MRSTAWVVLSATAWVGLASAQGPRVLVASDDDVVVAAVAEVLPATAEVETRSLSEAVAEGVLSRFGLVVADAAAFASLDAAGMEAVSDHLREGGELLTTWKAGPGDPPELEPLGPGELRDALREVLARTLASPPPGAIHLIDAELSRWTDALGREPGWRVAGGVLEVVPGEGSIMTARGFGDLRLHLEFLVPEEPDDEGQQRGNSGVYLQRRYEVQILDSHGEEPDPRGCGAIYGQRAPDHAAARPPGTWQSYDLWFRAARFAGGVKTRNARLTLVHNGVVVHDDVEITGKTGWGRPEGPDDQPLLLQDHGSAVRFRHVWALPLQQ